MTFELRYPKFIHAEALTHRILEIQPDLHLSVMVPDGLMYDQNLSRNASSSRATPVRRMIEDVRMDPVRPLFWGKNQSGMQAREELTGKALAEAKQIWDDACNSAIDHAQKLAWLGAHKQIVNRILEPYSHIKVVVTGTEWNNFFALRKHPDAQPEICDLATKMYDLMQTHSPKRLEYGKWHLPYVTEGDWDLAYAHAKSQGQKTHDEQLLEYLRKVSVARCARTSYYDFHGKISFMEEDIALFEKLMVAVPLHASPAEHQATPDSLWRGPSDNQESWSRPSLHGNLVGYIQFRKLFRNEAVHG